MTKRHPAQFRAVVFLLMLISLLAICSLAGAAVQRETLSQLSEDPHIVVQILNNREFAVCVKNPYGGWKVGAKVTVTSDHWKTGKTLLTNDRGAAVFQFDDFVSSDEWSDYFYGSLEIVSDGKVYFAAGRMYFKRGKPITIDPNYKQNAPYLARFTYNKFDLLFSTNVIDISPKNDAKQVVTVELENVSGTVVAELKQMGKVIKTAEGQAKDGKITLDLSDTWQSKLQVGSAPLKDPITLTIRANGQTIEAKAGLITKQAYIEEPDIKNDIGFSAKDGAFKITIPRQSPIFGGQEVSIKIPDCPVQFYVDTSGEVMIGLSFSSSPIDYDSRKQANPEKAKTANKEEIKNWMKAEIAKAQAEVDRVKRGLAQMKGQGGKRPYTETFKVTFAFALSATGKYDSKAKSLDIDASIAVSIEGEYSYTQYYTVIGFPAYISFGATVNASLGVSASFDIDFKGNSPDWSIKGTPVFEIGLGFSLRVTGGVGIKGVLDIYAEAGGGMDASLAISKTTDPSKPYPHFKATANFYVKIGYNAIVTSGSWKVIDKKWLLADNWDHGSIPREIYSSETPELTDELTETQYLAELQTLAIGEIDDAGELTFYSAKVAQFAPVETTAYETYVDGKTDYQLFPADTDTVKPSSVVPIVQNTFQGTKYQQLFAMNEFPIAFFIAPIKGGDGKVRNSLVYAKLENGALTNDTKVRGVIGGFDGHVMDFDVFAVSDHVFDVALTYREKINGDHVELFYTSLDYHVDASGKTHILDYVTQNKGTNKNLYDGNWGFHEYALLHPRVTRVDNSVMVAFLMQYGNVYEERWLRAEKPHIYAFVKNGSQWSDKMEVAVPEGATTSLDILGYAYRGRNDSPMFTIGYVINRDQSMKTMTNQELTVRAYDPKHDEWGQVEDTSGKKTVKMNDIKMRGDIHSFAMEENGMQYIAVFGVGDQLYHINPFWAWDKGAQSTGVKIPLRSASIMLGRRIRADATLFLIWNSNDKKSENGELSPTLWAMNVNLDGTSSIKFVSSGHAYKLAELPSRIDEYKPIRNADGGVDIVFTTAQSLGNSSATVYLANIPLVAAVKIYGIVSINPTTAIGEELDMYMDVENIGNVNAKSADLEVSIYREGSSTPLYKDKSTSIPFASTPIAKSVSEMDLIDLDAGELIDIGDIPMDTDSASQTSLLVGDRHTYKFRYWNKFLRDNKLSGVFRLVFRVTNVEGGLYMTGNVGSNDEETFEICVMIPDVASESLIGIPDVGVEGWVYYENDVPYLQINLESNGATPVSVDLDFLARSDHADLADAQLVKRIAVQDLGAPMLTDGYVSGAANINITMPLSEVFPELSQAPDQLVLRLNNMNVNKGYGVYNEGDNSWWDNEYTVPLGANVRFAFSKQALSRSATEGGSVSFDVAVTGGLSPYRYQWQVKNSSGGEWLDLVDGEQRTNSSGELILTGVSGVKTPTLTLSGLPIEWSGKLYRCIATDGAQLSITSDEAKLTVTKKAPVTGDAFPTAALLLIGFVSLSACVLLPRIRKIKK